MVKGIIVSNNPLIWERYSQCLKVAGSYQDVLHMVRDLVHLGHSLVSHPLAGSIKPNETPYKTIIINGDSGKLDMDSLSLIESALEVTNKFSPAKNNWSVEILRDLQMIDGELLASALEALTPDLIIDKCDPR